MPVSAGGAQASHDAKHPPPASASAHAESSSKNSRGLPYARPDKDYSSLYKELKLKVADVEMVCASWPPALVIIITINSRVTTGK